MSIRNPNNERSVKQRTESVSGMARKSSSSAKPVRAAAGSVTQGSGKSSSKSANRAGGAPLSKEERKEQKRIERDARDRATVVSNILLRQNPAYNKVRRVWWVGLGAGLALTAVSWLAMFIFPGASQDVTSPMGMLAMVCLILAYVCIIGSFIFDWVKVRPIRRDTDATVAGLSAKRMQAIIDEDYRREEAKRLAKAERKKGSK